MSTQPKRFDEEGQPVLQAYKVNLSKGDSIPCDPEELPSIMQAIQTGKVCKLKQGVFNPSYHVSITLDTKRIEEVEHNNSETWKHNLSAKQYGWELREYKGLEPLKDIFEGVNILGVPRKPESLQSGDKFLQKSVGM